MHPRMGHQLTHGYGRRAIQMPASGIDSLMSSETGSVRPGPTASIDCLRLARLPQTADTHRTTGRRRPPIAERGPTNVPMLRAIARPRRPTAERGPTNVPMLRAIARPRRPTAERGPTNVPMLKAIAARRFRIAEEGPPIDRVLSATDTPR